MSVRGHGAEVSVYDESQLIDQSLAGDSCAFGELVRTHQDRLFNAMLHLVGDHGEAEDVVQEAFVQAYVKLATFQRQSAFYTWLYRIAFNHAISRQRRKKTHYSMEHQRAAHGLEPADHDALPTDRLERQERIDQLYVALGQLTPDHRAILILREIEGCDYEAIAEILDINIGTVRSRLHRARMQLRDKLKHYYLA